ncbi:MAG: hypothetical protein D6759_00805 [Chloroflexi bacterium]|nr:MAG: hypothetical protein D6759_00805 [Chloroflexota bacterium]
MVSTLRPVTGDRDRYADWLVLGLVLVGLALGWLLRASVLSRTTAFRDPDTGISVHYPAGWRRSSDTDLLLRVRDPMGGAFPTTLELRVRPLAPEADLRLALEGLALERSRTAIAYKPLRTDLVKVRGQVATRRTFTFVYAGDNPYVEQLPVVVLGADVALRLDGERVVIVTLLAEADRFDTEQGRLRAFLESLRQL